MAAVALWSTKHVRWSHAHPALAVVLVAVAAAAVATVVAAAVAVVAATAVAVVAAVVAAAAVVTVVAAAATKHPADFYQSNTKGPSRPFSFFAAVSGNDAPT